MATGMLKFSPNNTVYIDLDLENHTANKAVDIDAEGVEWPICGGGGGGDYRIITGTLSNIGSVPAVVKFVFNNMEYYPPNIEPGAAPVEIQFPVVGDNIEILPGGAVDTISGDATYDEETRKITATGDFTVVLNVTLD